MKKVRKTYEMFNELWFGFCANIKEYLPACELFIVLCCADNQTLSFFLFLLTRDLSVTLRLKINFAFLKRNIKNAPLISLQEKHKTVLIISASLILFCMDIETNETLLFHSFHYTLHVHILIVLLKMLHQNSVIKANFVC